MSRPRPGEKCNDCEFCNKIYNTSDLKQQYCADREVCDCITYDENIEEYCLWHECVDDYYTGNIMEIKYCPKCGRRLHEIK